jgi:hypothetical protein
MKARWLVAFALQPLAHQFPVTPFGFSLLARAALGRLFVRPAKLHFPKNTFALHLLFQGAKGLIDIIVAYNYLNDNDSPTYKIA